MNDMVIPPAVGDDAGVTAVFCGENHGEGADNSQR